MRKPIIAAILIIALLLGACGKQEAEIPDAALQPDVAQEGEVRWKLEETYLPDAEEALKGVWPDGDMERPEVCFTGMEGGAVYRILQLYGKGKSIGICVQRLTSPYTEWENYPIFWEEFLDGSTVYVRTASVGQGGNVYALVSVYGEDGVAWQVNWTSETGFETARVSGDYLHKDFLDFISLGYMDVKGKQYFVADQKVQCFDRQFTENQEWIDTGYVWQFTEPLGGDGLTYLCGDTMDGKFCIWTVESREPVFASDDIGMDLTGKVVFSGMEEGYLCTQEGVWQFHLAQKEMENVFPFVKQGYSVDRVWGASFNGEGNLLMLAEVEEEYLLLEMKIDEDWKDKEELELAVAWCPSFLREAVMKFNRQSDEYYIVLREPEEGEDWNDYITLIQMEVSSGGGPAILGDDVLDWQNAAERGMLRDLTEDFADEKEGMSENVRSYGEVSGRTYAVPYCCFVDTWVVSEDAVCGRDSWTPEEFMECVMASGAEKAVSRMDGAELFWYLIARGNLIDWENGECRLNGEEAVLLLEFAGKYGGEDSLEDADKRIAEGKTLVKREPYINTVCPGAHITEALFEGKEVYIGYPADNPSWESGKRLDCNAFAVNQACTAPDGAVAFIKYLLSEECQDWMALDACGDDSIGFPVNAEALENTFLYAGEHRGMDKYTEGALLNNMGFAFTQAPVSDAGLEKLRKLLFDARLETVDTSEVESIVFEEAAAYFAGSRTAGEVCDIIQSRVQLYLEELK